MLILHVKCSLFFFFEGEFDTLVHEGTESEHEIAAIVTHVKYIRESYHNDIALIKLAMPIKFSRYILPACLPEPEFAEKVSLQDRFKRSCCLV